MTDPKAVEVVVAVEAPQCCGAVMKEERGFVTGKLFYRCIACRKTDLRHYSRHNQSRRTS